MTNVINNKALVLDLVQWVATEPRCYADVMRVWRTSCPRLTIWEDALDLGLVARAFRPSAGAPVEVTAAGKKLLATEGRI
jgi:hypothetical protein